MDTDSDKNHALEWRCQQCNVLLERRKAIIAYLGVSFDVELPCCPVCGQFFIAKELAEGKMRKAEMLLEDK